MSRTLQLPALLASISAVLLVIALAGSRSNQASELLSVPTFYAQAYAPGQPMLNQGAVLVPLTMLTCPPDDPHCGYGGVDTSDEAYNDPINPLRIIGEECKEENRWDCPFPGPKNYGPDSPVAWLPEEDMGLGDGLTRKVWPDYPEPKPTASTAAMFPGQVLMRMGRPVRRVPF
mmetsp:Transcript_53873/g.127313  ORF Transcript_53873/g.127313 Transcript_53873/m.127313 type:complete len:174 (+) Transcript_53873:3-524(+)